jgi:Ca2+-binding EF-hand superfamily protein
MDTEIKNTFDTFDRDKDGFITEDDLLAAIGRRGITIEMIHNFFMKHTQDKLNHEQFRGIMTDVINDQKFKHDVKELFDLCDGNENNCLTFWEIQKFFKMMDVEINDEKLDKLLQTVDDDNDRRLEYIDFLKLMERFK